MSKLRPWLCSALAATLGLLPLAGQAACSAASGEKTAALVELYTSEGCSSCPPADRQLSQIERAADAGAAIVPLALHVGYWDSIGWKDPFAQDAFSTRQRWLVQANQHRTVYTPHFFVSGTELRTWPEGFGSEVRRLNSQPAAADLRVQATATPRGTLAIEASVGLRGGDTRGGDTTRPAALYLAVTENGLVSRVTRGENRGVTLAHDHVVRAWLGPFPLQAGKLHTQQEVALPAGWNRDQLGLVGFVQDERSGGVLQAVRAAQCGRT